MHVVLLLSIAALTLAGCGAAPRAPEDPPLEVSVEVMSVGGEEDPLERAETRLLARRVETRREAAHAPLPGPVRAEGTSPESWPKVRVVNDTPYGLVVWVAGPCAREIVLPARGEHVSDVCEGRYELAAQVGSTGFAPLVGEGSELDNGSTYTFTFFVVDERTRGRAGGRRGGRR
jgi:hypothetical protein